MLYEVCQHNYYFNNKHSNSNAMIVLGSKLHFMLLEDVLIVLKINQSLAFYMTTKVYGHIISDNGMLSVGIRLASWCLQTVSCFWMITLVLLNGIFWNCNTFTQSLQVSIETRTKMCQIPNFTIWTFLFSHILFIFSWIFSSSCTFVILL